MPVSIPEKKTKVTCNKCRWYLIIVSGGYGDILRPDNGVKMLLNRRFEKCPTCGSTEFTDSEPSLNEKLNPVEYIKRVRYIFKSH